MSLVPRQVSDILAGAQIGQLRCHVDSVWQGFDGHDDLGSDDPLLPPLHVLAREKCEPVVAAAYVLDGSQAGHKGVRYAAQFQHVHISNPLRRPRAISHESAGPFAPSSGFGLFRTKLPACGSQPLNAAAAFVGAA